MVQVVLVRHGHPLIEGEDPVSWPLSDEGRRAASTLAGARVWETVQRIYASPERKARETAEILADERAIPVEVKEDLREVRRPFEALSSRARHRRAGRHARRRALGSGDRSRRCTKVESMSEPSPTACS